MPDWSHSFSWLVNTSNCFDSFAPCSSANKSIIFRSVGLFACRPIRIPLHSHHWRCHRRPWNSSVMGSLAAHPKYLLPRHILRDRRRNRFRARFLAFRRDRHSLLRKQASARNGDSCLWHGRGDTGHGATRRDADSGPGLEWNDSRASGDCPPLRGVWGFFDPAADCPSFEQVNSIYPACLHLPP